MNNNLDDRHYREELIKVLSEYDLTINEINGPKHDQFYWDQFETSFLEACYKVAMNKLHGVKIV
jgi:hypothetical protein